MKKYFYFKWNGIDAEGIRVAEKSWSENKTTLAISLKKRGIYCLTIKKIWQMPFAFSTKTILHLAQKLQRLLSTNIVIVDALAILLQTPRNARLKFLLLAIQEQLKAGYSFSKAVSYFSRYFGDLFCTLIYAGEEIGQMSYCLTLFIKYQEKILKLKKKCVGMLIYPCLVLVLSCVMILFVVGYIFPEFNNLFANRALSLPFLTQCLINFGVWMQTHVGLLVIILVVFFVMVFFAKKCSHMFIYFDIFLLNYSGFGKLIRRWNFYRWFETLRLALLSGKDLLDSMALANRVIKNKVLCKFLFRIPTGLEKGYSISFALHHSQLFEDEVLQLIKVAEKTGDLKNTLQQVATYYELELEQQLEILSQILEPCLLIFVSLLIGGIIVALYVPIFSLGLML